MILSHWKTLKWAAHVWNHPIMHCKPLSIEYVMYVCGLVIWFYDLVTENLHLASIFYYLLAKWWLKDFFNFEPWFCLRCLFSRPMTCRWPWQKKKAVLVYYNQSKKCWYTLCKKCLKLLNWIANDHPTPFSPVQWCSSKFCTWYFLASNIEKGGEEEEERLCEISHIKVGCLVYFCIWL